MLDLPPDLSNVLALADWLELSALEADDKNASAGDLTGSLQILLGVDASEELALQVMHEIEYRSSATGAAYPFGIINARLLQAADDWESYAAYIFCLCLSYLGWKSVANAPINPWHLFEDLACLAAEQYTQGTAYKFGAACVRGSSAFMEAINTLCLNVGEGRGYRKRPSLRIKPKDDKVDLVAWREFEDGRPSKLLMFGQCASGANWKDKVNEMQPDVFWRQWMLDSIVSPSIRSFYIPHRIAQGEDWDFVARQTGILFDRCRVAAWASRNNAAITADGRYAEWCRTVFPALRRDLA
jgi:hypothetical protein